MSFSFYPRTVFRTKSKYNSSIVVKEQFGKYTLHVNGVIQSGGLVEILWKKAIKMLPKSTNIEYPLRQSFSEASRNTKQYLNSNDKNSKQFGNLDLRHSNLFRNSDLGFRILILGLGGGTLVNLLKTKYPSAEITGVEIDEKIIDISKKYFRLNKIKSLKIVHADATKWINSVILASKSASASGIHQKKLDSGVATLPRMTKKFDLVFVDLYCGKEVYPELLKKEFIKNIKKILAQSGAVVINWLKVKDSSGFEKNLNSIFGKVKSKEVFSNKFYYCN